MERQNMKHAWQRQEMPVQKMMMPPGAYKRTWENSTIIYLTELTKPEKSGLDSTASRYNPEKGVCGQDTLSNCLSTA
jgi:hypothetical protein